MQISLIAVNSVTRSVLSQFLMITTAQAGSVLVICSCCHGEIITLSLFLSPWISAVPQRQLHECHWYYNLVGSCGLSGM